jgi:hypothetical protein
MSSSIFCFSFSLFFATPNGPPKRERQASLGKYGLQTKKEIQDDVCPSASSRRSSVGLEERKKAERMKDISFCIVRLSTHYELAVSFWFLNLKSFLGLVAPQFSSEILILFPREWKKPSCRGSASTVLWIVTRNRS